jgi:HEAT repeat protein
MATIADKIKRLLAQVVGVTVADEEFPDTLKLIEEATQRSAIYELGSFVLSQNEGVRQAAIAAVHGILSQASPLQLAKLDLLMREISPYLGANRAPWFQLTTADLRQLESAEEFSLSLLGLASFHYSGYVREAVIKRLLLRQDGDELPFLLIRLNDWVEPVRQVAEQAAHARLQVDYAEHWVANLALLPRLLQAERRDHKPLVEAVFSLLRQPECRVALTEGLTNKDTQTRKLCFGLVTESAPDRMREWVGLAFDDSNSGIRLWGAQQAVTGMDARELAPFLEKMLHDRFMPVRREALRMLADKFPNQAREKLEEALLDSHASMRWEGAYWLRKEASLDLGDFYRTALSNADNRHLLGAVGGLGENGHKEDAALVLPYVSHDQRKVRKQALRALSHLAAEDYLDVFLTKLTDPSPSVSREAGKAVTKKIRLVQRTRLWEIFSEERRGGLRLRILTLLSRLPKWESFPFLLQAATDSDEAVAQAAHGLINNWIAKFNRQSTPPSAVQLAKATQMYAICKAALPSAVQRTLEFYLRES